MAGQPTDFYDLKGDIESLLALSRSADEFAFAAGTRDALHPGQTAILTRKGQPVGVLGALHPKVAADLGLSQPVYLCEIVLGEVLENALPSFAELSKFPEIRRDLAVIVDKNVQAAELLADVGTAAGTYLTDLRLFDVYTGEGIDTKRKSLGLGLTFRHQSRNLADEDVNPAIDQVIDLLEKNYKAELR